MRIQDTEGGRNRSGLDLRLVLQPRLPSTAFIAFSVLRFVAVAQFVAQGSDSYLPDWGQSCLVLGFIVRSHYCLRVSRGRGVYSVFPVGLSVLGACLLMLAPLGHIPCHARYLTLSCHQGMEGSRVEMSGVSRSGCCRQPWRVCPSLGLENSSGYWLCIFSIHTSCRRGVGAVVGVLGS